jgi:hypothetical protein
MIGKKRWTIAEGYIPPDDPAKPREFVSHEVACILNAGDTDAHIKLTVFFSDREPAGPYSVTVAAKRTLHWRFNDLNDPEVIPKGKDYSSLFESDVPVIIQHSRLDGRKDGIALLSTIAYGED